MAEYSRVAKGNFTATGTSQNVILPFVPDFVEIWNYSNIKTAAANSVARAWWDNKLVDGNNNPTMLEIYNNSSAVVFDTIQTNGISTYSAGLSQQYGSSFSISGITKASQAVVTTTAAHGYSVGTTVILEGIALGTTNNMQLLNGVPFTIVSVGSTTQFTINWNTSLSTYTAISGSPSGAIVKQVLYPFLYAPGDNVIMSVSQAANASVATTMYHNFEPGQIIAFRVPNFWGMTQLNSLPNVLIPGQPIYGYVLSVTDNWTFVCSINTSAYTAFTTNATMTATTLVGLSYSQVLAVGDVNTGGIINGLSASNLYPSPQFPTSTNRVSTITGPAVRGAFVNNTSQGFVIGNGDANIDTSAAVTIIANGNIVYWRASLSDYANP